MTYDIRQTGAAARRRGRRQGQRVCPGPGHSPRDRVAGHFELRAPDGSSSIRLPAITGRIVATTCASGSDYRHGSRETSKTAQSIP